MPEALAGPMTSFTPAASTLPFVPGTTVRVADLEACGLRRSTIARRCRPGGRWQSPVPGVVVLHNAPLRRDDRRRVALVHAGPGAVITGLDALVLAGMERLPAPHGPVHVLIPVERRRTGHATVLVERTGRLPAPQPGRWPIAPEVRAVLDYTRRLADRDLARSALAEVVQRGRTTPFELAAELDEGSGRGSGLPRSVLREVGAGIRSVAEAKARRLVGRSRLPPPIWNPTLLAADGVVLLTPDAWFDDVAMVWEIDSVEWHLGPADYAATLQRRSLLAMHDIEVVATLPSRIDREPRAVLAELRSAYARAARRPRPPLVAIPAAS